MTLGEKSLGMILRNFYPLAFTTWQDTVFRVTGVGTLPGIIPYQEETNRIQRKFNKNEDLMKKTYLKIKQDLARLDLPIEDWKVDNDGDVVTTLNVVVPERVELRLDASLDVVYCDACGHLEYLSRAPRTQKSGMPYHLRCSNGGGRYRQAPIFIPSPTGKTSFGLVGSSDQLKIQTLLPKQIYCYYLGPNGACSHPENKPGKGDGKCVGDITLRRSYLEMNRQRPIAGLKIINNLCPKGFKNIPAQSVISPKPGSGFYYSKKFPNTDITSPLFTSVAWENNRINSEMDKVNSHIEDVKRTWFNHKYVDLTNTKFSKIDVLEIVYGIRIGGYVDHWMRGAGHNNVIGRMMSTQGFVLTIKPEIYGKIAEFVNDYKIEDENDPQEYLMGIIAHTLKHALLVLVPQFTGLEDSRFMGSYEILENHGGAKIYIFDNDDGGHGGFATLIRQEKRFGELIRRAYSRTKCPVRDCNHACGNCLYLRRCGKTNRELNRKLLLKSEILLEQLT